MILTETNLTFPLASVKPLDTIVDYRNACLRSVADAIAKGAQKRAVSPVDGSPLVAAGSVGPLSYSACEATGSLFLTEMPDDPVWKLILTSAAESRHSAGAMHERVADSRASNVYKPKIEWVEKFLRFGDVKDAVVLDVTSPPSKFSPLLKASPLIRSVDTVHEMDLITKAAVPPARYDAAVLLESLDRVSRPDALLDAVLAALKPGGLLFLTASVASGFDMRVLGFRNLYLFPPDRANCFTHKGLETLLASRGVSFVEMSTPGVLDVQIVRAHLKRDPHITVSKFESTIIDADEDVQSAFQAFLQQAGLSSFARVVGRKK